ncbi:MAG: biotin--[acetyl-CoA-carboxylase] ligase [Lachnospiraceae bacterium]|nr:biotin--[acetyl-CoA-carboxylase] ligase [Lachnospiraceae bacterium]
MKEKILKTLKEIEGFISGQELCTQFGVSRTAVWKVIKQLKEEGYEIEAVRNRGYILRGMSDVLSKAEILSCMETEWAGRNVIYFADTDSTNIQARKQAEAGAPEGTLVVADRQSGGKGRRGRGWVSPSGVGIWMSLVLRPKISTLSASMLTLLMAMATAKGVSGETGLECEIKWPNDLVLNKKKICGILTEMSTEFSDIQYVVSGIGINVGQTDFAEPIREMATSLYLESGRLFQRSRIIAGIMKALEGYYKEFVKTEDMSRLMDEYNARLVNCGNEVRVLAPSGDFTGVSEGIDRTGALIVKLPDGTRTKVISGEVSVRGLYSYV